MSGLDSGHNTAPSGKSEGMSLRRRLAAWLSGGILLAAVASLPLALPSYHQRMLQNMSESHLREYSADHPTDLDALYRLGIKLEQLKRHSEAGDTLLRVFRSDPGRMDALQTYAEVCVEQEHYQEATTALTGLLQAQPNSGRAWATLGRMHLRINRKKTAIRELEKATQLNPHDAAAFIDLADTYQKSSDLQSAARAYRQALTATPDDASVQIALGQVYVSLGQYPPAERLLAHVLQKHPGDADALAAVGDVRLTMAVNDKELAAALGLLKQARALHPADAMINYHIGSALHRLRRDREAVQPLLIALRSDPGLRTAANLLIQVLYALGRKDEGAQLGKIYGRLMAKSELEYLLEQQVDNNLGAWKARLRLSRLYASQGQFAKALLLCQEALTTHPGDAEAIRVRRTLLSLMAASQAGSPASVSPGVTR